MDDEDNSTTFPMTAVFDSNNNLRVNDINYDPDGYVARLWNFINGVKTDEVKKPTLADRCKSGELTCTKKTLEYTEIDKWGPDPGFDICILDNETNQQKCQYKSVAEAGDYYFLEPATYEDYQSYIDEESSACDYCKKNGYPDYYNAAKRYCEDKGGRLPTIAELRAGGYTSFFWASEEDSTESVLDASYGSVGSTAKYNDYYNVVCVNK